MWSVGCTLAELCTGKILFPGRDNGDMLRQHMEISGKFAVKMLRKGRFVYEHFTEDFRFKQHDIGPDDRVCIHLL
jgi:serine/threonine-protein kinase PRP4